MNWSMYKLVFSISLILISTIDCFNDDESSSSNLNIWTSSSSSSLLSNSNEFTTLDFYQHSIPRYENPLTLVQFKNKSVTCNDGTTAGYYIQKSTTKSKLWIIYLEGGWFCYNVQSCTNRWLHMKNLMSSTNWNRHKYGDGILSTNPTENPYWWNANHVFVPYCSSDLWTGRNTNTTYGFNFMGSIILESVINDLMYKLKPRSTIVLAGSSAGGIGVLLNIDKVQTYLNDHYKHGQITVKGIIDSAWFIESNISSTILLNLRQGLLLWNSKLPSYCYSETCFYGSKVYPHIKSELFIFQWLFDEIQMLLMNIQIPVLDRNEWELVYKFGHELRQSLSNVTSFMIPSCISHTILLNSYHWHQLQINSINLPTILHCWASSSDYKTPSRHGTGIDLMNDAHIQDSSQQGSKSNSLFSNNSKRRRRHRRRHKKSRHNHNNNNNNNNHHQHQQRVNNKLKNGQLTPNNKHKRNNNHNNNRSKSPNSNHHHRHWNNNNNQICTQLHSLNYRLIDSCKWPQCNLNCPKLINPNTGSEIEFKELLSSFGLDMKLMANVLGIDLNTLETMDTSILLKLLTQQQHK